MSEAIHQPIDELATLRRVNAELLTKAAARRAKVQELEASLIVAQGELATAHSTIEHLTVCGPMTALAESISAVPEMWLEQFAKSYKVESRQGILTLLDIEGKPVMKGDKPIPFEREALIELLTEDAHPNAKNFRSITIVSRARGAAGVTSSIRGQHGSESTTTPPNFGLR